MTKIQNTFSCQFAILLTVSVLWGCEVQPTTPTKPKQKAVQKTAPKAKATTVESPAKVQPEPTLPGVLKPDKAFTAKLVAAYEAKGSTYTPRTHHKTKEGKALYTNRLITQTSPYLLQHAHNPVNWYAWSEEAFEAARALNRPILLSVGYSTCHWCHVMERESFEDKEIAAYINANFVAIKVDREERPDIDDMYMQAVRMLTGRGGWPMTVVMTPKREPFFGGTYFPARDGDRGARQGFLSILKSLQRRYKDNPDGVAQQAKRISQKLIARSKPLPAGPVPAMSAIHRTALQLHQNFDKQLGGFGRAPKFPLPSRTAILLRFARRAKSDPAKHDVVWTLEKMSTGGIYDQVGGGFHRYAVDARWLVPHFEKMLYDNAQLVSLYTHAYQLTKRADFARVVHETLQYILREMTSAEGGFYSATDADSMTPKKHMEEGYHFTWTPADVEGALGKEDAAKVMTLFQMSKAGNFEGRNIPNTPVPLERALPKAKLTMAQWQVLRQKLHEARKSRPAPLRDDKILAAWNGMMISGFAQAGLVFDNAQYKAAAIKAMHFLLQKMRREDGALVRSYKDGKTTDVAFLDDYAFCIQALLDVYEITHDLKWLKEAIALQTMQDQLFLDAKDGVYFTTSHQSKDLIVRQKPMYDGAVPSANSVSAMNLLRLYTLTTRMPYKNKAEKLMGSTQNRMIGGGRGLTHMLAAVDFYHDRVPEIVLVKPNKDANIKPMLDVLRQTYLPNRALSVIVEGDQAHGELVPYTAKKPARGGKVTAYVCEHGRCELPTTDPKVFAKQIRVIKPYDTQAMPPLVKH